MTGRPESILDYQNLNLQLAQLKGEKGRFRDWQNYYRAACCDTFFLLNFVLSFGQERHRPEEKAPLWLHPSILRVCRLLEWQIENGGGNNSSARAMGKSTILCALIIREINLHPNVAMSFGSFEKAVTLKWAGVIARELEQNQDLQLAFPDRYWQGENRDDIYKAARSAGERWAVDDGILTCRRTMNRPDPTLTFWRFKEGTRQGSRFDRGFVDDFENDELVRNAENIATAKTAYSAATHTIYGVVTAPAIMSSNTWFHRDGLAFQLYKEKNEQDPRKAFYVPGEDLTVPGDGPMGGTPNYPHTLDSLYFQWDNSTDKQSYALQIACDWHGGARRRFHLRQWTYDDRPVRETARLAHAVITVDPSRGAEDPTVCLAVLLLHSRKYLLADGFREWFDPSEARWGRRFVDFVRRWHQLARRLLHVRIEVIGQATFDVHLRQALAAENLHVPVGKISTTSKPGLGFASGKELSQWTLLSGPAQRGELLIPRPVAEGGWGIPVDFSERERDAQKSQPAGEQGPPVMDLVHYFLTQEWVPFPLGVHDDVLDALKLVWVDPSKVHGERPDQRFDLSFPAPPVTDDALAEFQRQAEQLERQASWKSA